jgi:hypothetical protein
MELKGMASITQLWAGLLDIQKRQARDKKERYNISNIAKTDIAFADQADAVHDAIVFPPAGFYAVKTGDLQKYTRSMTSAEVHTRFLSEIFKGFSFNGDTKNQLDKILTGFAKTIGAYKYEGRATLPSAREKILKNVA